MTIFLVSCTQIQTSSEIQPKTETEVSSIQSENTQSTSNTLDWTPIGTIKLNHDNGDGLFDHVVSLAFAPDGTLYALGYSRSTDGKFVYDIAKWDGHSWLLLGGGFSGNITEFVVNSDGTIYLAIHEEVDEASGNVKYRIVKWNGSNWSTIGDVEGVIQCLLLDSSGVLYASGYYRKIGGLDKGNVAKWDGSNWSAVGNWSDEELSVQQMVTGPNGLLYALGDNRLSRWDGNIWTPIQIGGGIEAAFYSIAINSNGVLFTSGGYSKDDVYKEFIAKLEEANWSFIDSDFIDSKLYPQYLMGFSMNGTLYGYTSDPANSGQAKTWGWDGTHWTSLAVENLPYVVFLSPVENALYTTGDYLAKENDSYGVYKLELK